MKLAFVLYSYFPFGGLQKDFANIARACIKQGAQVSIFCLQWEGPEIPETSLVIPAISGISKNSRRRAFAQHIQRQVKTEFDLVVGFNKMPGLDYYFAADSCFAEKAFEQRSWLYRQTPRARQYCDFEKAVFEKQKNTKILLLSPAQREQFTKHYQTEAERLIDIPAGISRECRAGEDVKILRDKCRSELEVASDEYLLLQIGSAFETKGVDRSLRAIASLPEALREKVKYVLVGQDKPERMQALAQSLGIESQFKVVGGRDDIPSFLQGADLLIHPSLLESAGMVLLEAIVAGLPVLTTASCGYAYHVEKAQAGLVCSEPFSQQELNENLNLMLLSDQQSSWKACGIDYGVNENLYDMPETVAALICSSTRSIKTDSVNE